MSPIEIVAALLGIANIALLVRRSVWNYPFGLLMVAIYAVVFYRARLYPDACLQVFFFVVQLYGWWNWVHGRNDDGLVRVEILSPRERAMWVTVTVAFALAIGWFFSTYTNASAPWMDGSIAAMSVVGQYLLSVRRIENWYLWIAADTVAVPLYLWKGLYATSALYLIFWGFSLAGYFEWRREVHAQNAMDAIEETLA
jgi:nicotinamide mononucleotide transporter